MTTDLDLGLHWHDEGGADRWDTVYFDGEDLPGIAEVDVVAARKIDSRSPPGGNGARLVDKGYQPGKVTIRLRIWEREQLAAWTRLAPSLHYREERVPATQAAKSRPGTKEQAAVVASGDKDRRKAAAAARARARDGLRRERRAITISHPATDLNGIHLVYVERIETKHPARGVLAVTLHCLESQQETMTANVTRAPGPSNTVFGSAGTTAAAAAANRTAFDTPPSAGDVGPAP